MHRQCFVVGITAYKRIFIELSQCSVQLERIHSEILKIWMKCRCSYSDNFFWYGFWVKKCVEIQQLGCGSIGLLHLIERKRPCGCHRFRMVRNKSTSLLQKFRVL